MTVVFVEVDRGQQSAELGVQALDIGLVDRNVGRVGARCGVADRAEVDVVEVGRGHLVRIVAAVGGVRCVVRLVDEPRLVGLRGLVLANVVDRVVREGGRRVRRVGDRGPVDVVRHPVEVVDDAAAEDSSERRDPQVTHVLENRGGGRERDARAWIDAAAADVVLAEESVRVGGAVGGEAVEERDGRRRQHVAHRRHAGAIAVEAADDGAAGRRAHGARPRVVEHEAVLCERLDVRDRHLALSPREGGI